MDQATEVARAIRAIQIVSYRLPHGVETTRQMASIRPFCIEHREHWVSIPTLTVWVAVGVRIECSGSVQIIDFGPELGEAGIEIHLNGVTNPDCDSLPWTRRARQADRVDLPRNRGLSQVWLR
jgi:hypothetical protein